MQAGLITHFLLNRAPRRRLLATVATIAAIASPAAGQDGGKRALLVGCTRYPNLSERRQLLGPANDCARLGELLRTRFGFPSSAIITLSGWDAARPESLPTRKNIQLAMQRLIEQSQPGDQIVLFFAGHGAQQPVSSPNDPANPEPDGLDELFLPADVSNWTGNSVQNAIVDNEIGRWIDALHSKVMAGDGPRSGFVWGIFDTCHAGTATRGDEQETARWVPAEELGIETSAAPPAATERPHQSRGDVQDAAAILDREDRAGWAALFAAQSGELAPERTMPRGAAGPDAKCHGLLTYTLCEELAAGHPSLTYERLIQNIRARYAAIPRIGPHPFGQGDLTKAVLGIERWPARPVIMLEQRGGRLRLNAGALAGLTRGSVLSVHPPIGADDAGQPLGYVVIDALGAVDCAVRACARDGRGVETLPSFPAAARCEIVLHDFGDMRMKIFVEPENAGRDVTARPAIAAAISEIVRRVQKEAGEFVEFTSEAGSADWALHVSGSTACLVPKGTERAAIGRRSAETNRLSFRVEDAAAAAAALMQMARSTAQHTNLVRLAGAGSPFRRDRNSCGLEVRFLRLRDREDVVGRPEPLPAVLYDGDVVGFQFENRTDRPLDLTALYLSADWSIKVLFPGTGLPSPRLMPGKTGLGRIRIEPPCGDEHLVLIAVPASEETTPVSFGALAQPSLEAARQVEGVRGMEILDSPLGRLLSQAVFGTGNTRGEVLGENSAPWLDLISWRVESAGSPGR